MGFELFPERCDKGTVSYLEGERVPKSSKRKKETVSNLDKNSTRQTEELFRSK